MTLLCKKQTRIWNVEKAYSIGSTVYSHAPALVLLCRRIPRLRKAIKRSPLPTDVKKPFTLQGSSADARQLDAGESLGEACAPWMIACEAAQLA